MKVNEFPGKMPYPIIGNILELTGPPGKLIPSELFSMLSKVAFLFLQIQNNIYLGIRLFE